MWCIFSFAVTWIRGQQAVICSPEWCWVVSGQAALSMGRFLATRLPKVVAIYRWEGSSA